MVKSGRLYYPALDGLRLLGMLLVVLHHSIGPNHTSMVTRLLAFQSGNGLGPTLFFVLSGLLLTSILLQTRESANRYGRFLLRRSVRIFPLYYLYLGLAMLVTAIVAHPMHNAWIFGTFLQSTMLHAAGDTGSVLPMYHLWTLGAQEQFYLIWPLLVWQCRTARQLRWLCISGVAISLLVRIVVSLTVGSSDVLWTLLPCRMGEMVLGGLLAIELIEPTELTKWMVRSTVPLWAIYGVWTMHSLHFRTPMGAGLGILLVTLASGGLILSAAQEGSWLYRFFSLKPIAVVGKRYSYGIYIFHPLMLTIFSAGAMRTWRLRYPAELLFLAGVVLLSYHGFERRFLRIGSFIRAQDKHDQNAVVHGDLAAAQPANEAVAVSR